MAMHKINLDGVERNICHNFIDEIQMGGKPEKWKKVVHSNVCRAYKSEEKV